jgi:hypothetical protein
MGARTIATLLILVLAGAGPFQPLVAAQQPTTVPATEPVPPRPSRGIDGYDVAAPVVTVLKAPLNVGLCALGTGLAVVAFALTLGSGYRASARAVEEGCRGPWLIRGEDLRPEPERGEAAVGGY